MSPERWPGLALDKEVEREFEYALVYRPSKKVSLLTGVKAEYDYKLDISDDDVTKREAYLKSKSVCRSSTTPVVAYALHLCVPVMCSRGMNDTSGAFAGLPG